MKAEDPSRRLLHSGGSYDRSQAGAFYPLTLGFDSIRGIGSKIDRLKQRPCLWSLLSPENTSTMGVPVDFKRSFGGETLETTDRPELFDDAEARDFLT